MKKITDPRHKNRAKILRELFAHDFSNLNLVENETSKQVLYNLAAIDKTIEKIAPNWPISQINKIDLSILRLAVFELIIDRSEPFKVVLDEAVELAKEYGSQSSPGFINGALGNLVDLEKLDKEEAE